VTHVIDTEQTILIQHGRLHSFVIRIYSTRWILLWNKLVHSVLLHQNKFALFFCNKQNCECTREEKFKVIMVVLL